MNRKLIWPLEQAKPDSDSTHWQHAASNICLDFHGDPLTAQLVIFSDGNHHMALQAAVELFLQLYPEVVDVFYATTPPSVLIDYLESNGLQLGNLTLSRLPHIFISPPDVMNKLMNEGFITKHRAFMKSNGNVLLINKGNPKQVNSLEDLLRDDVRLFISNPHTEKASYQVYHDWILGLAQEQGLDAALLAQKLSSASRSTEFGERIHHREAPQALYDGHADVAMVYYHLALRYTRIFPEQFDFISLAGNKDIPGSSTASVITTYHIGLLNDPGNWGPLFQDFLFSEQVTEIYQTHGLSRP